jgi:hypothetical protein
MWTLNEENTSFAQRMSVPTFVVVSDWLMKKEKCLLYIVYRTVLSCSMREMLLYAAVTIFVLFSCSFQSCLTTSVGKGLLLSVDMGLRTGFAVYGPNGDLRTHSNRQFSSMVELRESIPSLIETFGGGSLQHLYLEGDIPLCEAWTSAVQQCHNGIQSIVKVEPSSWRDDLLTPRERQTGKDAKAAARLISRQIMWKSGLPIPNGPLDTDEAEAILIGFWAVCQLGWRRPHNDDFGVRSREKLFVERYCNGNVVLPPASYTQRKAQ